MQNIHRGLLYNVEKTINTLEFTTEIKAVASCVEGTPFYRRRC